MSATHPDQPSQEEKTPGHGQATGGPAHQIAGDENRSHGCFRGEEIGAEAAHTTPVMVEKKQSL